MDLSIVIPIYNREKTLPYTVDSILKAKSQNFEVLLVDDGSLDGTWEICKNYEQADSRCRALQKANGGVSSARNEGIKNAVGKYVAFCDSDDAVYADKLDLLIEFLSKTDVDLVVYDYVYKNLLTGEEKQSNFALPFKTEMGEKEIIDNMISPLVLKVGTDQASVWNKAFKKEIIKENQIAFEEKVFKGEDWRFVLDFLAVCTTAYYLPESVYEYRLDGSQAEGKYKRVPGEHLLGSIRRKLQLNRDKNLSADFDTKISWYKTQLEHFLYSAKAGSSLKELQAMRKDRSLKESVNALLRLKNKEYLRLEVPRKYYVYAVLIKMGALRFFK